VIRGFHGVVAALSLFNATDSPKQSILPTDSPKQFILPTESPKQFILLGLS
jgi:hypothetical protein